MSNLSKLLIAIGCVSAWQDQMIRQSQEIAGGENAMWHESFRSFWDFPS